jgi:hypothetical protein
VVSDRLIAVPTTCFCLESNTAAWEIQANSKSEMLLLPPENPTEIWKHISNVI